MPLLVGVGGQKSHNNGLVTGYFSPPLIIASCKMPRWPRLAHKAPDLQARAASLVSVSSVVAAVAAQ